LVKKKPIVALFGGTFDPPHAGHQEIVKKLAGLPYIDLVVVTPAYLNPFKSSSLATPQQRLEWIIELFDGPNIIIDDGEIEAGESVYTIDTYRRLSKKYDLKYITIGADNLEHIDQWREFAALDSAVTWLVVDREGHEDGYDKLTRYIRIHQDISVSSSQIRLGDHMESVDPKIAHSVQQTIKGNK